jgi:hypothetical protein
MLAGDPEGLRTVAEIRSVSQLLGEQLAGEPEPELTHTQRRTVESAGAQSRRPIQLQLRVQLRIPLSVAASILILLGLAFLVGRYWPASTPPIVENPVRPAPKVETKIPLDIKYPRADPVGTPPIIEDPHIVPPSLDPPEPIYVPVGTINLSGGRAVVSNSDLPADKLKIITDGDKNGQTGLDIGPGLKWVQIDLGARAEIYAVAVWHYYDDGEARAYRDVIVQISNDPNFAEYATVFSTDHNKSAGMEVGPDMGYVETVLGKVIDCKGVVGRYVRLYSKGNTTDDRNHYAEVEVHGVKPDAKATTALTPPATSTATPVRAAKAKPARRRVKKVPYFIKYPGLVPGSTPVPINEANISKPSLKRPEAPMMPVGTVNVALGKPVTSNEAAPVVGELKMVTDGDKSGEDGHDVDLGFGLKWVQIDLKAVCGVSAICVWHYHREVRAYRDVVVQVSNDPDFVEYQTIFNSDHDNSAGLGLGEDMGYVESFYGKFIWCPKVMKVRYVRLYSKGNTSNDQNHYTEVEVYGRASKGKAPTTRPAKSPTTRPADDRKTGKIPLVIKLSRAMFRCTPVPIFEPNVAKRSYLPPQPILVPRGTVNLALGKAVTSNEPLPVVGDLDMVTDGDLSGEDGHNVGIGFGLKWVQIDLESVCDINVIGVWHYHQQARAYCDVVVRISNDPDFINFTTLLNTDYDHSSGLGIGKDMGYIETRYGRLIDCGGLRGRYVRLYSNGNTSNDQNHYVEVAVYGRKIKGWLSVAKSVCKDADKAPLKVKYPTARFCY